METDDELYDGAICYADTLLPTDAITAINKGAAGFVVSKNTAQLRSVVGTKNVALRGRKLSVPPSAVLQIRDQLSR